MTVKIESRPLRRGGTRKEKGGMAAERHG